LASLFGFKFARQIALETLNSIFVFMYVLGEHVQYWYCSESEKELRRYDRDMQIYINTLYFYADFIQAPILEEVNVYNLAQ
jgi:hypothetical protein